ISRDYKVEVSGKLFDVTVIGEPAGAALAAPAGGGRQTPKRERETGGGPRASSEGLPSPPHGTGLEGAGANGAAGAHGAIDDLRDARDEDGERDRRPPRRQGHDAERRRRRRRLERRRPRRHRVAASVPYLWWRPRARSRSRFSRSRSRSRSRISRRFWAWRRC